MSGIALNQTSMDKNVTDYIQYKVADYIWIYVSPVLILVGTFGNFLSILVLVRKSMRSSTTMFYLTALSFGDLFTLYTGLLRYWIEAFDQVDIRNKTDAGCKIHTFLVYFSLDFTVWILVAVTLERWLCVSLPFRAKRICSLKMSRIVVIVIICVLFCKNMHFFFTVELVHTWEFRCDGATVSANHFLDFVWPWIDFSTFCLIPFTIMIVCNIKIISEMIISQRKIATTMDTFRPKLLSQTSNTCTSGRPNSLEHHASNRQRESVLTQTHQTSLDRNGSSRKRESAMTSNDSKKKVQTRRISSLTAMLLTVNCVFLITTLPIQVFLIGEEYWFPTENRTNEQIASHHLGWAIVNILQYSNNAIHFFLYCLTGPRFRHQLQCIFRRNNQISDHLEHSHTLEH